VKDITLTVVEDNRTYRNSLLDIIELSSGMECTNAFGTAEACLQQWEAGEGITDMLLLDLNLPGENGLKALPRFRQIAPETEVIILTQNDNFHTVLEAVKLGANGYLLKGATVAEIRNTIDEVLEGGTYIDPQLSRLVMNALCRTNDPIDNPLAPREIEVLELLAQGYSKKEVANKMQLSYHTIVSYVRGIFEKLESPNLAAAIAKAIRQQII
jgi:DNA-binding NarL/FixJ family response regulator